MTAPSADTDRGTARAAGLLYLATFVTSIPALALYGSALDDPRFALGTASDAPVLVGALLDLLNAAACVGTAVVLLPVLRRWSERLAVGFVTSRVVEAATIVVSVAAVLCLVSLHRTASGLDAGAVEVATTSLQALHRWTFLLGPGLVPGVNALLLGTVLLRSRLVPRGIPLLGLVGGPLLLASATATVLGVFDQVSAPATALALPVAAWELSLGLWLTFRGFRSPNG
jgi:hypothetical protein